MSNLIPFNYNSKDIRVINKDGNPWWVLRDVCEVLELSTPARVAERLEEDEVSQTHITDSLGREQETTIINESGLYNVILRSDKPEAKAFKRWITHEVIPSIRKTGSYVAKPESIEDLIIMQATAMKQLRNEVKQLTDTQQAIKDAVISEPDNWREDIRHKLNKIANAIGSNKFRDVRSESYKLLEQRADVLLGRRLDNLKVRLLKSGASKSKIDSVGKIDVIDEDKKLREIYGKIVSEYIIRYCA